VSLGEVWCPENMFLIVARVVTGMEFQNDRKCRRNKSTRLEQDRNNVGGIDRLNYKIRICIRPAKFTSEYINSTSISLSIDAYDLRGSRESSYRHRMAAFTIRKVSDAFCPTRIGNELKVSINRTTLFYSLPGLVLTLCLRTHIYLNNACNIGFLLVLKNERA